MPRRNAFHECAQRDKQRRRLHRWLCFGEWLLLLLLLLRRRRRLSDAFVYAGSPLRTARRLAYKRAPCLFTRALNETKLLERQRRGFGRRLQRRLGMRRGQRRRLGDAFVDDCDELKQFISYVVHL